MHVNIPKGMSPLNAFCVIYNDATGEQLGKVYTPKEMADTLLSGNFYIDYLKDTPFKIFLDYPSISLHEYCKYSATIAVLNSLEEIEQGGPKKIFMERTEEEVVQTIQDELAIYHSLPGNEKFDKNDSYLFLIEDIQKISARYI